MARNQQVRWAELHPRAVTLLGELGSWVYFDDDARDYYSVPYRAGRVLASSADGRAGYVLRPIINGGSVHRNAFITHAENLELYERFQHRKADKFFNVICPPFGKPRRQGHLALVTYFTMKGTDEEQEYVHHFENPDEGRPEYVPIYSLGYGQFLIPPGAWRVAPEGITYAPPPGR